MAGTNTIIALAAMIGASAALGLSQQYGWGAFGDIQLSVTTPVSCKALVSSVGWSRGAGARSLAETKALIAWSKRAGRHGVNYTSWHNAKSRDVTCTSYSEKSYKCTAQGRPCQQQAEIDDYRLF